MTARHLLALLTALTAASALHAEVMRFEFPLVSDQPGRNNRPDLPYTEQRGYGVEPGADVVPGNNRGHSETPFFFSANVPEGNYRVTIQQGGPALTVKAELRRLMLAPEKESLTSRSFIVNVRTPAIPGGGKVSLKQPRESVDEAWAWDNRLTLEFNAPHPSLGSIEIEPVQVPTVFILGDSTVCDQGKEPYASWGQMLPRFLKPEVAVANHAESGETLRSSTGAKRIDKVIAEMKKGDWLLIQYGHNDMKSKDPSAPAEYKATLKQWVARTREKGGTPVLITPMNRHRFDGAKVVPTLGDYPRMVREAAAEEKAALIDLNAMSATLYEALGPEGSIALFKHDSDHDPKFDATHHSPYGAFELARCVALGMKQAGLDLATHLTTDALPFDPAKPDPASAFPIPPSPGRTKVRPLGD